MFVLARLVLLFTDHNIPNCVGRNVGHQHVQHSEQK